MMLGESLVYINSLSGVSLGKLTLNKVHFRGHEDFSESKKLWAYPGIIGYKKEMGYLGPLFDMISMG